MKVLLGCLIGLLFIPQFAISQGFELGFGNLRINQFESEFLTQARYHQIPSTVVEKNWEEHSIDLYRFYCEQNSLTYDQYGIRYSSGNQIYYLRFTEFPLEREDFSVFKEEDTFILRYNKITNFTIAASDYLYTIDPQLTHLQARAFQNQIIKLTGTYQMNLEEILEKWRSFTALYGKAQSWKTIPAEEPNAPDQIALEWTFNGSTIQLQMIADLPEKLKHLDHYLGDVTFDNHTIQVIYTNPHLFQEQEYKDQVQYRLRQWLNAYIHKITIGL